MGFDRLPMSDPQNREFRTALNNYKTREPEYPEEYVEFPNISLEEEAIILKKHMDDIRRMITERFICYEVSDIEEALKILRECNSKNNRMDVLDSLLW